MSTSCNPGGRPRRSRRHKAAMFCSLYADRASHYLELRLETVYGKRVLTSEHPDPGRPRAWRQLLHRVDPGLIFVPEARGRYDERMKSAPYAD